MSLIEMTTEQKAQTMTILHTVWSWGGWGRRPQQKATTPEGHTRRPYQKAITEDHFQLEDHLQSEGHQTRRP